MCLKPFFGPRERVDEWANFINSHEEMHAFRIKFEHPHAMGDKQDGRFFAFQLNSQSFSTVLRISNSLQSSKMTIFDRPASEAAGWDRLRRLHPGSPGFLLYWTCPSAPASQAASSGRNGCLRRCPPCPSRPAVSALYSLRLPACLGLITFVWESNLGPRSISFAPAAAISVFSSLLESFVLKFGKFHFNKLGSPLTLSASHTQP